MTKVYFGTSGYASYMQSHLAKLTAAGAPETSRHVQVATFGKDFFQNDARHPYQLYEAKHRFNCFA
jgi:hypothetical protein